MSVPRERLEAVLNRLQQVAATKDLSIVLDPDAVADAQLLSDALSGDEPEVGARYLLGIFHWYRHQALPRAEELPDLQVAVDMLTTCFYHGFDGVPEILLPLVADNTERASIDLLLQMRHTPDPAVLSTAVRLWRRMLNATPADHPDRAARLTKLAFALRIRFERLGETTDLDAAIDAVKEATDVIPAHHPLRPWIFSQLGLAAKSRSDLTGIEADLDAAISALRIAVEITPPEEPDRSSRVSNLGTALLSRYELTGATAELDAAVGAFQAAVAAAPSDDPKRATFLSNLARAFEIRFSRINGAEDVHAAIEALRAVADTSVRLGCLARLGNRLREQYQRTGSMTDLDVVIRVGEAFLADPGIRELPAAIPLLAEKAVAEFAPLLEKALGSGDQNLVSATVRLWQRIVDAIPASHPDRASGLSDLGIALMVQFKLTGLLADLGAAIEARGEAAQVAAPGDPHRAMYLSNLGIALRDRFELTGLLADLDAAIEAWQKAVEVAASGDPDPERYLFNLAVALQNRFDLTGVLADLDAAIEAGQGAVQATVDDDPGRPRCLFTLGVALWDRFELAGALTDLEAAIDAWRSVVGAIPVGDRDHAPMLSNLGIALQARFRRAGVLADLEAAIEAGQAAVDATPTDHPDRAGRLSNLGAARQIRFERIGALVDLEAAIEALQAAAEIAPDDHPGRAMYLSNLGNALRNRFERTGAPADLEAAIEAGQAAVETTPAGHSGLGMYLSILGIALRTRFERNGQLADLEAAIEVSQAAVDATPADHPYRPAWLTNLGNALRVRFERNGQLADLEAAIEALQASVDATPEDHPDRAMYLSNLGGALQNRFGRTRVLADIDAAIAAGQAAVDATPVDHSDRAVRLSNLGGALQDRFELAGVQADLDAAIMARQVAVDATQVGHKDRAAMLSNLGTALRARFKRTSAVADLNGAIQVTSTALVATPDDHPDRAMYLINLGNALHDRFKRIGAVADREAAFSALTAAAGLGLARPSVRVWAAAAAAAVVVQSEPGRAADLLEGAVRLLGEVAPRQLGFSDQLHAIGEFVGLGSAAATLALADTRLGATSQRRAARALRLLEAGRAVLLSQALGTRDDVTDLRREHPDLAERFAGLRDRFDQPDDIPQPIISPDPISSAELRRRAVAGRRQLADHLAETLAEIRALDGFGSFGLPPTSETLLAQAASGPVVTFNVNNRSDALLLTTDGITLVELPGLAKDILEEHIRSFHQALHTATNANAVHADRMAAQRTLTDILGWLWDTSAEPVLDALGYHQSPPIGVPWPRVWWAPGGLLGLLPIHAAGHHAEPPANGRAPRTVMDRIVSSYTPTIRALRYSRQHARHTDGAAHALIVAMPTTPGLDGDGELPNVPAEVARLRALLPSHVILIDPGTITGEPASPPPALPTRANVFALLPGCQIAHFACHGANNPSDPSKSLLMLHDYDTTPLTVASLASTKHERLELVYLSACRTAFTPANKLIDEAIHIASAFQLVGSRHVIGTLWGIDDAVAVDIAAAFYTHLRTSAGFLETDRAAHSLHHATLAARDTYPQTPSLWAAYVHAGA